MRTITIVNINKGQSWVDTCDSAFISMHNSHNRIT